MYSQPMMMPQMMPQMMMPQMMPGMMMPGMYENDSFSDREKKMLVVIIALVAFVGFTYYKMHYKTLSEFANKFRDQIDDIDFQKIQNGARYGVNQYVKFKVSKTERAVWAGSLVGETLRNHLQLASSVKDLPQVINDPTRNITHVLTKTDLGDYIYIPEQTPSGTE